MIFLPIINALFSKSSVPEEPEIIDPIPYTRLTKIFQTFNTEIYDIEENVTSDDDMIDIVAKAYQHASSPISAHLSGDKDLIKIHQHSSLTKNNGYISFLEYTHTVIEKGDEHITTLLICDMNDYIPTPHVGISGFLTDTKDGYSFIPLDAFCLTTDPDRPYMVATDNTVFMGILGYANQALLQIIGDQKLDPIENQKWVSDKKLTHVELSISKLRDRNFKTLLQDIEDYKSSKTPENTYATGPVI